MIRQLTSTWNTRIDERHVTAAVLVVAAVIVFIFGLSFPRSAVSTTERPDDVTAPQERHFWDSTQGVPQVILPGESAPFSEGGADAPVAASQPQAAAVPQAAPVEEVPASGQVVTDTATWPRTHTVQRGETLYGIVRVAYGVRGGTLRRYVCHVAHASGLSNPDHLQAGQVITLLSPQEMEAPCRLSVPSYAPVQEQRVEVVTLAPAQLASSGEKKQQAAPSPQVPLPQDEGGDQLAADEPLSLEYLPPTREWEPSIYATQPLVDTVKPCPVWEEGCTDGGYR